MRFVEGVCEAQKILLLLCTISFVLTFPLQVFTIKKMVKCEWFGTVAWAKRLGLGSPRGLGHKDVNVLQQELPNTFGNIPVSFLYHLALF